MAGGGERLRYQPRWPRLCRSLSHPSSKSLRRRCSACSRSHSSRFRVSSSARLCASSSLRLWSCSCCQRRASSCLCQRSSASCRDASARLCASSSLRLWSCSCCQRSASSCLCQRSSAACRDASARVHSSSSLRRRSCSCCQRSASSCLRRRSSASLSQLSTCLPSSPDADGGPVRASVCCTPDRLGSRYSVQSRPRPSLGAHVPLPGGRDARSTVAVACQSAGSVQEAAWIQHKRRSSRNGTPARSCYGKANRSWIDRQETRQGGGFRKGERSRRPGRGQAGDSGVRSPARLDPGAYFPLFSRRVSSGTISNRSPTKP